MHKYLLIVLSMIIAVFSYLSFNHSLQLTNEEIKITNQKFSVGEDDPYARIEQEFMMLRDPEINQIPLNIFRREQEFAKNLPKRIKGVLFKDNQGNESQALTWTSRGPNNVGGRTRALGMDIRTTSPPNVTIIAGGVSVFLGKIILAQDDHTACILVAEDKDYFTYVEPPLYIRSTPRENLVRTATINVTYNGFSAAAETAFQFAVDILETEITSLVTIELIANWTPLSPGVLGSAGANGFWRDFTNAPLANTWYAVALANKLAGSDLSGTHDINANFNSNFSNWYLGTDGLTPAGQYDFVSVVLHEIIHGLGFSGSMSVSGAIGSWGFGSGFPFVYDVNTLNGSDQRLLNTTLFPNPSTALGTQLTSNNIFFDGANAVIGNGGTTNPKLYVPGTWNPGSSYSHWDDATYPAGNINSLMTHAIGTAEAIHHPGFITRGLLKDSGWTVDQPVPVELSAFSAKVLIEGRVQLDWTTETEVNNYGFEVQRSEFDVQSPDWKKIAFVEGHGNSSSPKEYSFLDEGISYEVYLYRLKQIDNDGTYEYSNEIEVDAGEIPNEFVLEQNFPNPFNPSTTIKFAINESVPATLIIYDVLGNEIIELFNEQTEAGKVYNLKFEGGNLSSGIYFYKLETPSRTIHRKMLLIK